MIREFSKCGSVKERVELLDSEMAKTCSMAELYMACGVMGYEADEKMPREELLKAMKTELEHRLEANAEAKPEYEKIDREEKKLGNTEAADEQQEMLEKEQLVTMSSFPMP